MVARPFISEQFADKGYIGPLPVLSRRACTDFLEAADRDGQEPLEWWKGAAATSRPFYEVATRPEIVDVVAELLGGEVMLWGASVVDRVPDESHPWHTDIESAAADGTTVSVWVGLENTTRASSLVIVPYSHRFGVSVQEVRHENGKDREETTQEDIARWATERDASSGLVRTDVRDGEALFFDGRLWHGSHNTSRRLRRALLLQYARPDTAIRIPDLGQLDWPFRLLDQPRPPCLIVRGSAHGGANRIVPPPPVDEAVTEGEALPSQIHRLRLPLEPDRETGWKPYPAFSGGTASLRSLSCHASVLLPGHSPHPPHTHDQEEILLLLAGEVELMFSETDGTRLEPGELVYYPAGFAHTLKTTSALPATYVMFKWRGATRPDSGLPCSRFGTSEAGVLFEGPTAYLRKLHGHVTILEPGDGYEPHVDAYDVAIVVLEGEVETIGGRAEPHDVVFYRAGEPHGMRNVGDRNARYLVFELHGGGAAASGAPGILDRLRGLVRR